MLSYSGDTAVIEMVGDRNPKTDKPSVRKASFKIGDSFSELEGKKIILEGKIVSTEVDGKLKLSVEADYSKTSIL